MDESNYRPSGEIQGDTKPLADKGLSTGFQGTTHGVDFSLDATQSLGCISDDTQSNAYGTTGTIDHQVRAADEYSMDSSNTKNTGDQFTGSLGRFDGGSAAPDDKNVNGIDDRQFEANNHA